MFRVWVIPRGLALDQCQRSICCCWPSAKPPGRRMATPSFIGWLVTGSLTACDVECTGDRRLAWVVVSNCRRCVMTSQDTSFLASMLAKQSMRVNAMLAITGAVATQISTCPTKKIRSRSPSLGYPSVSRSLQVSVMIASVTI